MYINIRMCILSVLKLICILYSIQKYNTLTPQIKGTTGQQITCMFPSVLEQHYDVALLCQGLGIMLGGLMIPWTVRLQISSVRYNHIFVNL